ncbi:MAG: DUF2090 domain-containing protein, partial [Rhodobacteraceae bacterium]|nr:DUF2090 domain-containing protein [Paracoccaceae bacterium]
MTSLDLITIGRSSVDLYGAQIGGRLEDMGSFDKYIGGSPTNIACGTSRLGLRSAVITGVGDEHMGRFIIEQLQREGVETSGVKIDPDRLTALVLLGIRDEEQFPLIFYRENCADMGLCEDDIDPDFIRSARAVVATGTHLSNPQVEAATIKALNIARDAGLQTALDIDYRPNLWGVAGHGDGESRFVESDAVTQKLQTTLHLFDLIVGTEEEFHIGWLDGETWPVALKYANACGAFAVSRHGCTPAYPSWEELQFFFKRGITRPDLRNDAELEQVHWATNRAGDWSSVKTFAFDHRMQLEDMAGYTKDKGGAFKELCLQAALQVQAGQEGYGILCDNRIGRAALHAASGTGLWIGRPTELPGSRPIQLEPELGEDLGQLREWARENVVKLLVFCHPDDDAAMRAEQEEVVKRLWHASRRNGLEFLLEIIPSKVGTVDDMTTATLIQQFYDLGVYPDWWKLEPFKTAAAWQNAVEAIERNDPYTRGIVVLGLDASEAELAASFAMAAQQPLVKGFAVGRTIFGDAARA